MGSYVTLTMRDSTYNEVIDNLLSHLPELTNCFEIQELVHLIDFLEEEKYQDKQRQNAEYKRWMEQQQLWEEGKPQDQLFYGTLLDFLKHHNVEFDSPEVTYHFIMDLIDLFEKHKEKEFSELIR